MKKHCLITFALMLILLFALTVNVFGYNLTECKTWNFSSSTYSRIARYVTGEGGENNTHSSRLLASHMANLFEERGVKNDSDANKVLNSWYNSGSDRGYSTDEAWWAMEEVFKEGKRFLPRYVTEFDGFCEMYQNHGGKPFTIDGVNARGNKSLAQKLINEARRHESWCVGPWGGKGYYYTHTTDGTNGNVFYYNPNGALYSKYKSDDNVFERTPATVKISWMTIKGNYGESFVNRENRTMVPLRAFAESAGASVDWNDYKKEITLKKGLTTLKFWIGKNYYFNGFSNKSMDTSPIIIESRTYIPLRFAAEAFGYKVDWDGTTRVANCY